MTDVCPKCRGDCGRPSVDVGVGVIYGPWTCESGGAEPARELCCFRCGKKPEELEEYVTPWIADGYQEEGFSIDNYVSMEEGTYNPDLNTFACTPCYIAIGMPSSEQGWKAPARIKEEETHDGV